MSEIGTIDAIARALTAGLPAGWREVSAVYRATAPYAELDATLVGPGGEATQLDPLPDGLEDVTGYPRLLAALADRRWSDDDLARLTCRNVLRVMGDAGLTANDGE